MELWDRDRKVANGTSLVSQGHIMIPDQYTDQWSGVPTHDGVCVETDCQMSSAP